MDNTNEGMQIEEGKYYLRADGGKEGPMVLEDVSDGYPWRTADYTGWWSGGGVRQDPFKRDQANLIAEWTEEPTTGTLKELNVRPGDVVECVQSIFKWWTEGNSYKITKDGTPADNSGSTYGDCEDPQPAVKFHIISRTSDTPKTSSPEGGADYLLWGEMTDEEKGALLLAHHEGKVIEYYSPTSGNIWRECANPKFCKGDAYRVRPEPKWETWELWMRRINHDECKEQRVGTIQTADGKPDCNSIKMEEL